ncbi:MAG: bifunctional molybdenum cofactor biosynthesis protein MoaC/MoaB [Candidatus Marinimicrobia bacterium]|nr:bifunctional molybdenum cofactor biosynthesis protein MoaC/MoaB [Candidatus Neomarinimicrobiota bacterium]MBL7023737.1 bifunctional molybdenum cofactor biosynthesis protein MoaC/MoaB [Candidatus Neomarinimicrobiota bacterium]MBL7109593.1 bifunctional molybdenum cofactor biosynthesis protein MoaC/MoaB [Candidatus Neomarinimicrobiota bacterium]
MIDVSPKFNTLRWATAEGVLTASAEVIQRVKENTVPKGDVLQVARAAGIQAAKRTADWIVFCHPLPLDWVGIKFEVEETQIRVISEVKAVWKTGVEMEAMSAVMGAMLNIYDMLKPLDDEIIFNEIKLIKKKGGKSQFTDSFEPAITSAVLVISDSTYKGDRKDKSGVIIKEFLEKQPVDVKFYEILPDKPEMITERLTQLADDEKIQLIITTGGTGFGPKDFTPESTKPILDKEAPGITETIRKHGKERTPYAMLSREIAGIRGDSLIITLPGSSKGAKESLEALFPGLLHIFPMMWGGGH